MVRKNTRKWRTVFFFYATLVYIPLSTINFAARGDIPNKNVFKQLSRWNTVKNERVFVKVAAMVVCALFDNRVLSKREEGFLVKFSAGKMAVGDIT